METPERRYFIGHIWKEILQLRLLRGDTSADTWEEIFLQRHLGGDTSKETLERRYFNKHTWEKIL